MAIATATPPSSTATAAPVVESIVAAYKTHEEAKAAVRKLEKAGVPIALMAMGLSKDEALKYQSRVEEGEFLVTVMGSPDEIARARSILENTGQVDLNQFQKAA
jgi:hypothetical protein